MLAPVATGLSNIMQVAWVTPDLDLTMAQFGQHYSVPNFFTADVAFSARLFGEEGDVELRLALANVDGMQIELIQPVGGSAARIYREALPADGTHANVFHHVCVKIEGPIENWDRYLADLSARSTIDYTGEAGPGVRFVYTDERATLGIWLEHVWYEPAYDAQLSTLIPTYISK